MIVIMAGIDKTYISGNEYPAYRQWWIDNYDKMVKELGFAIYLFPFQSFEEDPDNITPDFLLLNTKDIRSYKNTGEFAIWNTTESTDKWLIKNCPFDSFRKTMLSVYPRNWKGFKGQDWITRPNRKPICRK